MHPFPLEQPCLCGVRTLWNIQNICCNCTLWYLSFVNVDTLWVRCLYFFDVYWPCFWLCLIFGLILILKVIKSTFIGVICSMLTIRDRLVMKVMRNRLLCVMDKVLLLPYQLYIGYFWVVYYLVWFPHFFLDFTYLIIFWLFLLSAVTD